MLRLVRAIRSTAEAVIQALAVLAVGTSAEIWVEAPGRRRCATASRAYSSLCSRQGAT